MKKGDIVAVVATSGEYVGELVSSKPVTLANPKMIVNTPEGGMGFSKGVAVTGEVNPTEMIFGSYVFIAKCNKEVSEAHITAVSGIEIPKEKKIIT
tara:strand:+ start:163 stop:450 length:288 start_codon:yes stop_codon:yes gene_type:complete